MGWLHSLDVTLLRFINGTLSNPVLDFLMPYFSSTPFFIPILLTIGGILIWKGGRRGRIFVGMAVVVLLLGDSLVCNTLKHAVGRLRPFHLAEVHVLVGRTESGSMPSSHTANWFAATVLAFIFYRRSLWFMLPLAVTVSFSRVYNGVHYPSDVLVGAILGCGYAALGAWGAEAIWRWVGKRWFPWWWQQLPSLLHAEVRPEGNAPHAGLSELHEQWLRLGYLFILLSLAARWLYLAAGKIELSEDEAYQWLWSKHLALSYYSKPPLIAVVQCIGTQLFGDTAFGVRFFSPLIAAIIDLLLLRFLARETGARAGFVLLLTTAATPLLQVGATLMTIDSLSVLFWVTAMVVGWRAIQFGDSAAWRWTGLWMGLGSLSKYTALLQWASWAMFFWAWPAARRQLRRSGLWQALLINAICLLPVIIWNSQNDWVTLSHLHSRAGFDLAWRPTLNYCRDFLLSELFLLNPIFFVGILWALVMVWRRERENAFLVFLLCMGAPLFLGYLLYTLRARVQPNWIAPAVLPLLCLLVSYAAIRWRSGMRLLKPCFLVGLWFGLSAALLLHETNLVGRITGRPLPAPYDPLTRVRGWKASAVVVEMERSRLLAEGRPVFIIGAHYGMTSLLSFYLPATNVSVSNPPLIYYHSSNQPENQFYFWPGYQSRRGANALYVELLKRREAPAPPPEALLKEFVSVTDLGTRDVSYGGRVIHTLRFLACRNLR